MNRSTMNDTNAVIDSDDTSSPFLVFDREVILSELAKRVRANKKYNNDKYDDEFPSLVSNSSKKKKMILSSKKKKKKKIIPNLLKKKKKKTPSVLTDLLNISKKNYSKKKKKKVTKLMKLISSRKLSNVKNKKNYLPQVGVLYALDKEK